MDDQQNSIGLTELLAEIDRDLDDFRKKHSGDYSVKNVTLWWDLERERVLNRHQPTTLVKTIRKIRGYRRLVIWFLVGVAVSQALNLSTRLLLR